MFLKSVLWVLCVRAKSASVSSVVKVCALIGFIGICGPAYAQSPVTYHLSFPEAQHHRMQVEVTFADVPAGTLQVIMSRTSPGRYAVHEFAKNVFDVQIDDGKGTLLRHERPNTSQWDVAHKGVVRVRYKVFGDRVDGTFLGIDSAHAHLNIPAALMWARGLEDRSVRVYVRRSAWLEGSDAAPAHGRSANIYRAQPALPR